MISYTVSHAELIKKIKALDAEWLGNALAATSACNDARCYVKTNAQGKSIEGLWGDIKEVFIKIQHGKCCYCERLLESPAYGKIEHDVEHFRPKSRLKNWFSDAVMREFPDWPAALSKSGSQAKGYYLLAFDPRNYATSCKTCNSIFKRDYFPIAGEHELDAASPPAGKKEKPFLVFPLGDEDEPAEDLIQFDSILAQPVYSANADLYRHWRARVTIYFFGLNRTATGAEAEQGEEGRENLYRDRAERLSSLADCLDAIETSTNVDKRKLREDKVKRLIDKSSPHSNCCRSFLRLWVNPAMRSKAVGYWGDVERYLQSQTK